MASGKKLQVVALDDWVPPPTFAFDHEFVQHRFTPPDKVLERIQDATVVIISGTLIAPSDIEKASRLQLISANGTGTDHVPKVAIRQKGISLCRVPAQNTESVSEHALAMYYGLRRRLVELHYLAMDGESWKASKGNLVPSHYNHAGPRINAEEMVVIIGYGAIGKHFEAMARALGMRVLIAERKGSNEIREGRTSFEDAIKAGTVFILATPLDATTRDLLSEPEFKAMQPSAFVINVGRGGTINEPALVKALKAGQIAGAATDVFEKEPATKENCPLLDPAIPNLLLSPHAAWYSDCTLKNTAAIVKANVEGFVAGKPQNLVISEGKDV